MSKSVQLTPLMHALAGESFTGKITAAISNAAVGLSFEHGASSSIPGTSLVFTNKTTGEQVELTKGVHTITVENGSVTEVAEVKKKATKPPSTLVRNSGSSSTSSRFTRFD